VSDSHPFGFVCGGFLVSPWLTFLSSPPLIPDSRISRIRLAAVAAFPVEPSFTVRKLSTRLHTSLNNKVISTARYPTMITLTTNSMSGHASCRYPLLTESPFAHRRCYLLRDSVLHCLNRHYPIFLAHTGSCARPKVSRHLDFTLVCLVFAGYYEFLLSVGPSRHYLYSLCIGAWIHTPQCPLSAFTHFFLRNISLTFAGTSSAHENFSTMQLQ
jgi:hypothetical protein